MQKGDSNQALDKWANELGAYWFRYMQLAGGNAFVVDLLQWGPVLQSLCMAGCAALDLLQIKAAQVQAKNVQEGLSVVVPQVPREKAGELIGKAICRLGGKAVVAALAATLRRNKCYEYVWMKTDLQGALDLLLVHVRSILEQAIKGKDMLQEQCS